MIEFTVENLVSSKLVTGELVNLLAVSSKLVASELVGCELVGELKAGGWQQLVNSRCTSLTKDSDANSTHNKMQKQLFSLFHEMHFQGLELFK